MSDPRPAIIELPPVDGHRLTLLSGGAARLDTLIGLIDGAQQSVELLFYIMESDAAAAAIRDALGRAAARGVRVRALLDGFGCSRLAGGFLEPMRDAGADLCLFHPRYGRRYLIRNHQKLVIVDGHSALIGGANIAQAYLGDAGDDRWRDLWLLITAPAGPDSAITRLGAYFDAIFAWTQSPRGRIRDLDRLIRRYSDQQGALQWRLTGPLRRRSPWRRALIVDLHRATRVDLLAAYFAPPLVMLRRLKGVARRGRVRIVTAARSDNHTTIAAARHTYPRLLRRGIEIYEYRLARLHSKLLLIDDVAYLGSANFDIRSLYLNLELMLRIEDRAVVQALREFVDGEIADSDAIALGPFLARAGPLTRLRRALAYYLVAVIDYSLTRRINVGVE